MLTLAVIGKEVCSLEMPYEELSGADFPLDLSPEELERVMDEAHSARDELWAVFLKHHHIFQSSGVIHNARASFSSLTQVEDLRLNLRYQLYQHWKLAGQVALQRFSVTADVCRSCDKTPTSETGVRLMKIAAKLWCYSNDNDDEKRRAESCWFLLGIIFAPFIHALYGGHALDQPALRTLVSDEILSHQTSDQLFRQISCTLQHPQLCGNPLYEVLTVVYLLLKADTPLLEACMSSRVLSDVLLAVYRNELRCEDVSDLRAVFRRAYLVYR